MDRKTIEDLLQYRTGLSADAIEALAEYAKVGLINIDLQTGEIALNRTITQLTGYEPGDLPHTGNTKEMLTFEDDRERVNASMGTLMTGESDRYQMEYRMRRADGSIVSIEESAIVYERDEDGRPTRLAGLCQDLSRLRWAEDKARKMELENKRLAQGMTEGDLADQNRMLRASISAAAMIIGGFHQDYETVLRQSLQILAESIQASRIYLWRNTQQDGKMCCFLRAAWSSAGRLAEVDTRDIYCYDDILPGWKESFHERYSIRTLTRDMPAGMRVPHPFSPAKSVLLAPLYLHGEFWGMLGFEDMEEERLFTEDEAEIMVSGAMVVASSVSRNETFGKLNEAREEAMASTKAKSEFLSRMSHEIRTPMNAIIGMTTIAKKTDDPERIRYCLDKVDASSRQLLSLINDVLDMSKIDSGKFEIVEGEFDFEAMMQNVFNVVQVKLDEKHQNFRVDFDQVFTRAIITDELRLSQVLINLLGNAIKFTPDGGEIRLVIHKTDHDADHSRLRVEVVDNGIGITSEQQEKLFQSFEQADGSITRQYGGSGLGLAICKKIVGLMGGDIWVESEAGQGSRFIFEVEVGWGEKLLSSSVTQTRPGKMRVLVVDDAPDVRDYFQGILASFSLDCDTAADGEEALAKVKQSLVDENPYNMIFIDWNMPGMNGGTTATEIRKLMNDDAVVVMISVADWADIEKDAKSHGVTNFLSKPVLPSMLYNTIVRLSDNTLVSEKTPGEEEAPDWAGRTILLAEDIEINREIIHSILDETGAKVVDAVDGVEAVDLFGAKPEKYDLILMDMQMPNLDGLEATRRIRALADPWAKQVPILAMTANAFKEDAQMCFDAGMNDHLAKPLDVDILMRTLNSYFSKRKS